MLAPLKIAERFNASDDKLQMQGKQLRRPWCLNQNQTTVPVLPAQLGTICQVGSGKVEHVYDAKVEHVHGAKVEHMHDAKVEYVHGAKV